MESDPDEVGRSWRRRREESEERERERETEDEFKDAAKETREDGRTTKGNSQATLSLTKVSRCD
jgi:hypothetical protein